jgi:hypothetical protein
MELAGRLTGIVRNAGGVPLQGAVVYAIGASVPGVRSLDQVPHTRTGADGTWVLAGLRGGMTDLGANADGYRTRVRTDVEVVPAEERTVPAFSLDPGMSISGRVVLEDGKGPVRRATVFVYRDPQLKNYACFGRNGAEKGGGRTRVDSEGRFTITGLSEGKWDVLALTLGMKPVRPAATGVEAGTKDVELVFVRSARVLLRVVDGESGTPVKRFHLLIRNLSGPKRPDGGPAVTEEMDVRSPVGEYGFPAREDDEYYVETSVPGYRIDRRRVGPLKGGPTRPVKIVLLKRE